MVGENKKNPLKIDGHKLKKGGLIAIYEYKKISAEASIQQRELKVIKKGIKIKRI